MTDINELKQKNDRMFILVCLNFSMLLILLCALLYVGWGSMTLIRDLRANLQKAEQAVADLRGRIQSIDAEVVMNRAMENATAKIEGTIRTAIQQSDLAGRLNNLTEKVETAQQRLVATSDAVRSVSEKMQGVDTEQLAQQVSYNMLKGLGDGFTHAAESRNPDR